MYPSVFGEYAESIWRIWRITVICDTQNRIRIRGKYLNVFGEYGERIYACMEKNAKRLHKSVYSISSLIIIQILIFQRFFLTTLYMKD
jgi:hypothetical protein